jgi:hypothetical protein
MWLGWKRPRLAGWLLLALAVIASLSLYATPAGLEVAPLLILVAPLLLSAVLFLLGARSAKSEL